MSDPFVVRKGGDSRLVLTAEHAGNRVPPEFSPADFGEDLLASHWGHDLEIARLIVGLSGTGFHSPGAWGVASTYTRLLVDLNRDEREPSLIPLRIEGRDVPANAALTPAEKRRRLREYYRPYHDAVDRVLALLRQRTGLRPVLVALHSFTPVLAGRERRMDVGVLWNAHQEWVAELTRDLRREDFDVAQNRPYSGKAGRIYSANLHGRRHRAVHLEVEVNNRIFSDPEGAQLLSRTLAGTFRKWGLDRSCSSNS